MKNLFFFITGMVLLLFSCKKIENIFEHHHKDTPCPVISASAVPDGTLKAFQSKHPGIIPDKWFNKDNNGYAALFNSNGTKGLDFFDNNGNFQKEEIDNNNQKGNHQDNDKGCECETD